jgi:hypothetical protein
MASQDYGHIRRKEQCVPSRLSLDISPILVPLYVLCSGRYILKFLVEWRWGHGSNDYRFPLWIHFFFLCIRERLLRQICIFASIESYKPLIEIVPLIVVASDTSRQRIHITHRNSCERSLVLYQGLLVDISRA